MSTLGTHIRTTEDKETGVVQREAELQCSPKRGLKQSYDCPLLSPKDQTLPFPHIDQLLGTGCSRKETGPSRGPLRAIPKKAKKPFISPHGGAAACSPVSGTQMEKAFPGFHLRALNEGTWYRAIDRVQNTGKEW